MYFQHAASGTNLVFDDPNLISASGLEPVMRLAGRAGLGRLAREHVAVTGPLGANTPLKVECLVAGMLLGADSIEDMNRLRDGALTSVIGQVRAPSTLGSFLRAFNFGNVRQLQALHRRLLAGLARQAPLLPGAQTLAFLDTDASQFRVYGPAKQGAGFGTKIRTRLADFLRDDLKLELNEEKTLITHARTQAAKFLGYEITVQRAHRPGGKRVDRPAGPAGMIKDKCGPYLNHGKPEYRAELLNHDDHQIISTYGAKYRGIAQYYLLAGDVSRLNRLEGVAKTSMLKTLCAKHRSTVTKMARKYKARTATPHGPRTCFEATVERPGRKPLVARFGGIPLIRQKKAVLIDRQPVPVTRRKELITRLRTGECELCEQRAPVEVHQVAKLADLHKLGRPQPAWAALMIRMRRKTLVVCAPCHHQAIHNRQPTARSTE